MATPGAQPHSFCGFHFFFFWSHFVLTLHSYPPYHLLHCNETSLPVSLYRDQYVLPQDLPRVVHYPTLSKDPYTIRSRTSLFVLGNPLQKSYVCRSDIGDIGDFLTLGFPYPSYKIFCRKVKLRLLSDVFPLRSSDHSYFRHLKSHGKNPNESRWSL